MYNNDNKLVSDLITQNGFDSGIYDNRLINMERELNQVDISRTLNIKQLDNRLKLYSSNTPIILQYKGNNVAPMMAGLYLRGNNKRTVLYYLVKYTKATRLPGDKYETYYTTFNNVKYEIGFNMDNSSSYMKVYNEKKWENIYYNMEHNKTTKHIWLDRQATPEIHPMYGDTVTSLGHLYIDNAINEVENALSILEAYKDIPEVQSRIEELLLDLGYNEEEE